MGWIQVTPNISLRNVISLNIFLVNVNFNKFTDGLPHLHIFSILAKFQDN